ncbi:MAG: 30S ribosomal protein S4 [bacterium]
MDSKMNKQCAQCRRAGTKLFLKGEKCNGPKCALVKRNYPSGQHGLKRKRDKKSVYGKQLAEKQKAKEIYGLRERQFSRYMKEAVVKQGDTGEFLFSFLESRLDNVVFKMGLATSRPSARQIVNHGHIAVNGRKVDIPSFRVKVGDVISLRDKSKSKSLFAKSVENLSKVEQISWLNVQPKEIQAKVLNRPMLDSPIFDVKSIIEFYSRKI